jgi:hypothetical protein
MAKVRIIFDLPTYNYVITRVLECSTSINTNSESDTCKLSKPTEIRGDNAT